MGFPNEYLQQLQAELQPGTSALVILGHSGSFEGITSALSDFEGQLLRQTLTEEIVTQLNNHEN